MGNVQNKTDVAELLLTRSIKVGQHRAQQAKRVKTFLRKKKQLVIAIKGELFVEG